MSSPRLRRLRLDQERLEARFSDWPPIQVTGMTGVPPEEYQVSYNIRSIYSTPTGQILERNQHVVEIKLSLAYPRRAPQCKMLTPIFHPNFDEVSVCIGDFWAASEGLDDLIVRIGRMISYQEYNIKSPLNGLAAKWAAQNAKLLPVDSTELAPPFELIDSDDVEKLVIKINDSLPAVDTDSDQLNLHVVTEERAETVQVGNPRLDFGMIAVELHSGRTTVGRTPGNNIQLTHPSVSGHHAEIIKSESSFILRDLNSTNGSLINGSTITEALLRSGDRICFGDLEAEFIN